jgi:uncharacterized protein YqeY
MNMTLEALQQEMIAAMKSGDKFRKTTISTVIARIKNTAIDKGCRDNISEDIVDAELLKAKKITQEMIDTCPESRQDLLEDYKKQMEIIREFAPVLITDELEITTIVKMSCIELVKSNRGQIMKWIKTVYGSKVDMGAASKVLNNILV